METLLPVTTRNMGQKEAWDALISRMEELESRGMSRVEIARMLGVARSYVTKMLSGTLTGGQTNAGKMFQYLRGVGLEPEAFYPVGPSPDDYDLVPKVRAVAGMGESDENEDGIEGYYAFRKEFIRSVGSKKNLELLSVKGDSMQPTLEDGDVVMIDRSKTRPEDGKLFAVRVGDSPKVKRLYTTREGLRIVSDNPQAGEEFVPYGENADVIGKVVWIARCVK